MSIIRAYRGVMPTIAPDAFIAENATIIGDVVIGEEASIWYAAVLRGDVMPIRVGARTSIQDGSVIHATGGWSETTVGDDCIVGHGVILHGCFVGDRALVGMGSILLDGARLGSDSILGAGSLLPPRKEIPSGVLAVGRPAKIIRELTDEDRESIRAGVEIYVHKSREYRGEA